MGDRQRQRLHLADGQAVSFVGGELRAVGLAGDELANEPCPVLGLLDQGITGE